MLLLNLARRLLLQLLHMIIMILHMLLISSDISLARAGELLVPVSLPSFLLLDLILLGLFQLVGAAVCVLLDLETCLGREETRGQADSLDGGGSGASGTGKGGSCGDAHAGGELEHGRGMTWCLGQYVVWF